MKHPVFFFVLFLITQILLISREPQVELLDKPHYSSRSFHDASPADAWSVTASIKPTQQHFYHDDSLQNHNKMLSAAILKAIYGPEEFQKILDQAHLETYGVSYEFLWGNKTIVGLYETRDFQTVENWIIKNQNLTKLQALNIWDGYCRKRIVGGSKKNEGRNHILQEYDRRIERINKQLCDESKAQNEAADKLKIAQKKHESNQIRLKTQKEILQQYLQEAGLDIEQCIYLPQDFLQLKQEYMHCAQVCKAMLHSDASNVWNQRLEAVQKSITQDCSQNWCEINLSEQLQGYLIAQGLSVDRYKSCYGTALQQRLHAEQCTLLESIAQTKFHNFSQSSFLNRATECCDASYWSNQFEVPILTMRLIDFGNSCYNLGSWAVENSSIYLQAINDGIIESAWDFVYMVAHPREMVENIGKAAWFICDSIMLADEEALGSQLPVTHKKLQENAQIAGNIISYTIDNIEHSTGPQRVKMATKFVGDCFFQHKALQILGAVSGAIRSDPKVMKLCEYAKDAIGYKPELAAFAQGVEEIEHVVQKSLQAELCELRKTVSHEVEKIPCKSALIRRPFKDVLADIVKLGNQIPLSNQALCAEVKAVVTQMIEEANVLLDTKFRKQFGSKWTMDGNMKKRVNMDIDHALNYEVKFKNNNSTGFLEIEFSGGHLAGSTQALADKGLIKIFNKSKLATDCWKYDFVDVFTGREFSKTEFHASWTKEMIVQQGWDLFENVVINEYLTKDKKLAKCIKVAEQELSIVIKKHEKDINIVTIIPYEIEMLPTEIAKKIL